MRRSHKSQKIALWAIAILFALGVFVKMLSGMDGATGAVLVFFLVIGAMLLVGAWGWGKAIENIYNAFKDQQERQVMRDEIEARTLRKLREEQDRRPPREEEQLPRPLLPRWNETDDQYEARRSGLRQHETGNLQSPKAWGVGSQNETASEVKSRSAVDESFSEQTRQRYCTNCGTQARTGDRFCAACGHELTSTDIDAQARGENGH